MFELMTVIILQFVIIAYLIYMGWYERKQLISRIQAKDLREYKAIEEPKKKKKEEEKTPVEFL